MGDVLSHRRVFQAGQRFGDFLDAGVGGLQTARLHCALERPTADDLLACHELEALELCFDRATFWVRCDPESDEIGVAGPPEWSAARVLDLTDQVPWSTGQGLVLWKHAFLMDPEDYHDRLQLVFGPLDRELSIQLEFATARLLVYSVVPHPTDRTKG